MNELLVPLHIERLPKGLFLATSDALPGLVAQGRTVGETIEIARDVAKKLLESCQDHGDPIPSALKPLETQMDVLAPVGV